MTEAAPVDGQTKSATGRGERLAEWVAALNLNDSAKEARIAELIASPLPAVREWNNTRSFTNVPAGINLVTGQKPSDFDRQIIANSAMPKSVHENLMTGLRKELSEEQVEVIFDK